MDVKINAIVSSLQDRMRFYKLRIVQNASSVAATFNAVIEGEEAPIQELEEPLGDEDVLVGEKASRLSLERCLS